MLHLLVWVTHCLHLYKFLYNFVNGGICWFAIYLIDGFVWKVSVDNGISHGDESNAVGRVLKKVT